MTPDDIQNAHRRIQLHTRENGPAWATLNPAATEVVLGAQVMGNQAVVLFEVRYGPIEKRGHRTVVLRDNGAEYELVASQFTPSKVAIEHAAWRADRLAQDEKDRQRRKQEREARRAAERPLAGAAVQPNWSPTVPTVWEVWDEGDLIATFRDKEWALRFAREQLMSSVVECQGSRRTALDLRTA